MSLISSTQPLIDYLFCPNYEIIFKNIMKYPHKIKMMAKMNNYVWPLLLLHKGFIEFFIRFLAHVFKADIWILICSLNFINLFIQILQFYIQSWYKLNHFDLLVIKYANMTLLVEMKDKEFTSHKAKYALQFGTNIFMVGLSLTFKS